MEANTEQQVVLKLLCTIGKTVAEVYRMLKNLYGDECVPHATALL